MYGAYVFENFVEDQGCSKPRELLLFDPSVVVPSCMATTNETCAKLESRVIDLPHSNR